MEKLKEELENMNDLMEQKDTLTQKLEVILYMILFSSSELRIALSNALNTGSWISETKN